MATARSGPNAALRHRAANTWIDFTQTKAFAADPFVITRGEGVWVWDDSNNRYLDGFSGVLCMSLGYRNRAIIDAITAQHEQLTFSNPLYTTNDRTLEFVDALIGVLGDRYAVVKPLGSGSEATEMAIKVARQFHRQSGAAGRYKIVSLFGSYHGSTMGALAATGNPRLRLPYEPLPAGFVRVDVHGVDDTEAAARVARVVEGEGPETIAAVIVEPIMQAAGVQILGTEFLRHMRELCDAVGALLIFDEVVTGFGRLGAWTAAEKRDVWPDILDLGKGISGGHAPLAAVAMTAAVANAFLGEPGDLRQYQAGHTFAGNPVSAAAGLAVIDAMRDGGVFGNVAQRSAQLRRRFETMAERHDVICDVRGEGLLFALDVGGRTSARGAALGPLVQAEALRRGLMIRGTGLAVVVGPPLVITEAEADQLADRLGDAFDAASAALA